MGKQLIPKEKVFQNDLYFDNFDEMIDFITEIKEEFKDKEVDSINIDCTQHYEYGETYSNAHICVDYIDYESDSEYQERIKLENEKERASRCQKGLKSLGYDDIYNTFLWDLFEQGLLKEKK